MKKHALFVVAILALVIFASGCVNQDNINSKTYSNNGISFNYPAYWQEIPNIKTALAMVAIGDPNSINQSTKNVNTVVVIQKIPTSSGITLKQAYDNNYAQLLAKDSSFKAISDANTTVDGTIAYVNTHIVNVNGIEKQEKAVWLEKSGYIYVILCGALSNAFNGQQANFDMIINSFKVQ